MFPWQLLRSREEGGTIRKRTSMARHMYNEGMLDAKIAVERGHGMWWNEVVRRERPRVVQRRALLVRQCEEESNNQVKYGNKKRGRNQFEEVVVEGISAEIVID
jgi:hypothetical protein